ncbi:MAG: methyltransferase domain-containing protein [Proteobacteria bacterium]|nr:methyltransferase domain-containing protein [Pseudomonadota bacterium]
MDDSKTYWLDAWKEGNTPWDLKKPHQATSYLLNRYTELRLRDNKEKLHVFIPGAGRAHDAQVFLDAGHKVTAMDIAPQAVEYGQKAFFQKDFTYLKGDILSAFSISQSASKVDIIFDRAVLCALPHQQRLTYSQVCHHILKKHGAFISIPFYTMPTPKYWQGPPFLLSPKELMELFSDNFYVLSMEYSRFSKENEMQEYLMILEKK